MWGSVRPLGCAGANVLLRSHSWVRFPRGLRVWCACRGCPARSPPHALTDARTGPRARSGPDRRQNRPTSRQMPGGGKHARSTPPRPSGSAWSTALYPPAKRWPRRNNSTASLPRWPRPACTATELPRSTSTSSTTPTSGDRVLPRPSQPGNRRTAPGTPLRRRCRPPRCSRNRRVTIHTPHKLGLLVMIGLQATIRPELCQGRKAGKRSANTVKEAV